MGGPRPPKVAQRESRGHNDDDNDDEDTGGDDEEEEKADEDAMMMTLMTACFCFYGRTLNLKLPRYGPLSSGRLFASFGFVGRGPKLRAFPSMTLE